MLTLPSPAATRALLGAAFVGAVVACSTTDEPPPPCVDGRDCPAPAPDSGTTEAGPSPAPADAAPGPDAAPVPARELSVLFIGNSYTEYNNLPQVVRELGAATGTPIAAEAIVVGGATLYDHWNRAGVKEKITGGKLDAVVLQGQSLEALGGESAFDTYATRFGEHTKAAGARAVWFATWARGPGAAPSVRGEAVANRIEQAYSKVALATGGQVARVGAAFHQAQIRLPNVSLYTEDQSHPTREGTLLAACTIAHRLTGRVPRVPTPAPLGIPQATAQALCDIGSDVRCLEGGELCGGACFKLQTDPRHCGTCGRACAAGDPCVTGQCGCLPGQKACALECRNLQYDRDHCGACGNVCALDRYCAQGTCACSGGTFPAPVTLAQLSALDPACTQLGAPGCENAGKQLCLSRGCSTTALGPPTGHAPNDDAALCLPSLSVVEVEYAALQTFDARCDGVTERLGEGCAIAVNRYCQSQGAAGGFGHHRATGTQVPVSCLPTGRAFAVTVDQATLQSGASRCTPHPTTCNTAAWNICRSFGFVAGFGPVEASASLRTIVCIRN